MPSLQNGECFFAFCRVCEIEMKEHYFRRTLKLGSGLGVKRKGQFAGCSLFRSARAARGSLRGSLSTRRYCLLAPWPTLPGVSLSLFCFCFSLSLSLSHTHTHTHTHTQVISKALRVEQHASLSAITFRGRQLPRHFARIPYHAGSIELRELQGREWWGQLRRRDGP